jgi:hypothetical protein
MKVGDLVRNTRAVWNNPEVPGGPYPAGSLGVVVDIRPDTLNNPPLMDYVDVMLWPNVSESVWCGNYTKGHFEVVSLDAKSK